MDNLKAGSVIVIIIAIIIWLLVKAGLFSAVMEPDNAAPVDLSYPGFQASEIVFKHVERESAINDAVGAVTGCCAPVGNRFFAPVRQLNLPDPTLPKVDLSSPKRDYVLTIGTEARVYVKAGYPHAPMKHGYAIDAIKFIHKQNGRICIPVKGGFACNARVQQLYSPGGNEYEFWKEQKTWPRNNMSVYTQRAIAANAKYKIAAVRREVQNMKPTK